MDRFQLTFLALIAAQAAHSLEEYWGRLYDEFPPARFVSAAISSDRERGFVALNLLIVALGLWCWCWPVRRRWPSAIGLAWAWAVIEGLNGIGHPLWSLREQRYTPGVVTAGILLIIAIYLARQLRAHDQSSAVRA